ncbi:MAG: hypothetical protein WAR79_12925 [Melioribacteraceae bacterium]
MNKDEEVVDKFLTKLEFGKYEYEPDGNIPPDFAFERNIGIEVRRLNRNYFNNSKVEGLEELQFRIHHILNKSLELFNSNTNANTYWVFIHYRRKINYNTKNLFRQFNYTFQKFLDSDSPKPERLKVNDFIEIRFLKADKKYQEVFKYGGGSDFNTFGFVNAVIIENVSYCIAEKSQKIIPHKEKYKSWWLILVNHLYVDLDIDDKKEILQYLNSTGEFDKVTILNPSELTVILEIFGI